MTASSGNIEIITKEQPAMMVEDLGPRTSDYYEQNQKEGSRRVTRDSELPHATVETQAIPQPIGYAARLKALLKKLTGRK